MEIRSIHKGQKGFSLLELLVALAITGLITTGITMVISQTFTGSTRSSNHMVAVRQVQEAGYWVSYYAFNSQNLTITGDSGFPLILRWVDFDASGTNASQKVVFNLNLTSSGLRGSYYVGNATTPDPVKTGQIPVFSFVSSNKTKTNCQVSGGSAFSLPDSGDAFKITGGNASDNGRISVAGGSIAVTKTGSATYVPATGAWTTNTTADTITLTAASSGTRGSWTSETRAATVAITADSGAQAATLSSAKGLIFTVTATVGTGQQQESETRTYIVVPKSAS
jgi:prepilin-type N-terminal cleavage/methylation domain-containing protein